MGAKRGRKVEDDSELSTKEDQAVFLMILVLILELTVNLIVNAAIDTVIF